ncbi:MAG: exodeoxyribonuclease III [Solirubrobacterales bacterium]|nr:exodeoxyribonuclease III [Solirubrobacterales bacterium]MCB8915909.1 exodeoxyribonuclease III [Thermoleophilales bacterium]
MRIFSWNVNGIRAVIKKGDFGSFVKKYDPDIFCMQETKAEQGQAEIDLPHYEEYWNSAEKKGYSGTAIFTRQKPIAVLNDFAAEISEEYNLHNDSYGDPHAEGRVITAEYENFFLVTTYVPNAKRDLSRLKLRDRQWDPALLHHMKMLDAKKPVLVCGDMNVAHTEDDLANPKANVGEHGFTEEERRGFQNFLDAGFVDTFRLFTEGNGHYSWWSYMSKARERNAGWRIDYFLASERLKKAIVGAEIHNDVMGSDHCPVSVELDEKKLART